MGTTSKALSLLRLFSNSQTDIGLTELSRQSGMNKATVYRLMSDLAEHGFVEQIGPDRLYRIGPGVMRLAVLREATVPLRSIAKEHVRALADEVGETTHVSQVSGDELSTLTYAYSAKHGTRVTMEDAERLPFHATSSGLVVLTYANAALVHSILSKPLERRTAHTIVDSRQIKDEMKRISIRGYAESISGFEQDVHSVAAPIFAGGDMVCGALAIAAPVGRVNEALRLKMIDAVQNRARMITEIMGGAMPPSPDPA